MSRERKTGPKTLAAKHFTISINYLVGLHVIRRLTYDYRPIQFQPLDYQTAWTKDKYKITSA